MSNVAFLPVALCWVWMYRLWCPLSCIPVGRKIADDSHNKQSNWSGFVLDHYFSELIVMCLVIICCILERNLLVNPQKFYKWYKNTIPGISIYIFYCSHPVTPLALLATMQSQSAPIALVRITNKTTIG